MKPRFWITLVKYGAYKTTTVSKWFRTAHSVTTWVFIDLLLYKRYTGKLDGHYPTTDTVRAVRYWNRLLSMNNNGITKIVFFWDMNQHNRSRWTSQIKSLFESVNALLIYNQLLLCDVDEFENKLLCNFEMTGC